MALTTEDPERRYYAIGEVADILQVNRSLLRYWETEFPALQPKKNRKGRRLYTQADLELLRTIHYLVKTKKYTLQGAREKIAQDGEALRRQALLRHTLERSRSLLLTLRDKV